MALGLVFSLYIASSDDGFEENRVSSMLWGVQTTSGSIELAPDDYDGIVATVSWFAPATSTAVDNMEEAGYDMQTGLVLTRIGMVVGLVGIVGLMSLTLSLVLWDPEKDGARGVGILTVVLVVLALAGYILAAIGIPTMYSELSDLAESGGTDTSFYPGAGMFLLPVGFILAAVAGVRMILSTVERAAAPAEPVAVD